MALRRFFYVLGPLLVITLPAHSKTIHVPADHPTIQAGIDAAVAGDEVLVAPGTYTGPSNKNLELRGRDIVVRSEAGAAMTIIDCEGSGRGFHLLPPLTSAARIEGFTIKNGDGAGGANEGGGGMYIVACSPTIANCIFQHNVAHGFVLQGGGGAIAIQLSSSLISGCRFVENRVGPSVGIGGAIAAKNSLVTITDCDFENNLAESHDPAGSSGGAIAYAREPALGGPRGSLQLSSSRFIGNEASEGGGVAHYEDDPLSITDCIFLSNRAGEGSGLFSFFGMITVSQCTFASNLDKGAGCIYLWFGEATIENTIVAQNGPGAALHVQCELLTIRCTNLQGNEGGDWEDCLESFLGVDGNIAMDPLFCDLPAGDLHLCSDSPCAPEQSGACGLIGALPVGCGSCGVTPLTPSTWGQIKHSVRR